MTIAVLVTALLAGCSDTPHEPQSTYSDTITIYMPVEYVDTAVLRDFEQEFNVAVVLEEFDSNEEMYDNVMKTTEYDVLVPSDYMIDRLIQENYLAKLDKSKLRNAFLYIDDHYLNQAYDQNSDYSIPYMVGTLGILYNRRTVQINSWKDALATNGILMVDSERDVVGLTLKMLGYSMNSVNDTELVAAEQALLGARGNIRGFYETTDIVDLITAQEAFVGVVYSGDGRLAVDLNPNLAYIIPEEGSNKWSDAFVVPANSSHIDLAHEFINFMCRPNIAIRNMSSIGYASPIPDARREIVDEGKIMFASDEDLERCETFIHSSQIVSKHHDIWTNIR